jgi:hypothetical protein
VPPRWWSSVAGVDPNKIMRFQIGGLTKWCFALAISLCCGCTHLPNHMTRTERILAPPVGKALVNFHRPTGFGGAVLYPIFFGDGSFIGELPGESIIQYVCDPGKCHFIGWMEHVSVVEAEVAPDKVYDLMIDVQMGWVKGNMNMVGLTRNDPRRAKLPAFEKREKNILATQRAPYVIQYEQRSQARIQEIKRDFLGGGKSARVEQLKPDDCR